METVNRPAKRLMTLAFAGMFLLACDLLSGREVSSEHYQFSMEVPDHWLGQEGLALPRTTMLGALCHYVSHADPATFQPMKANFGLMPPLSPPVRNKRKRHQAYASRAMADLTMTNDK